MNRKQVDEGQYVSPNILVQTILVEGILCQSSDQDAAFEGYGGIDDNMSDIF